MARWYGADGAAWTPARFWARRSNWMDCQANWSLMMHREQRSRRCTLLHSRARGKCHTLTMHDDDDDIHI
eukprot:6202988-Pleurochrysis_carterae.AAC.1